MKPKLYLSLILLVVFSFAGCRKDRIPPTYYLPQEVKDYMYFKPGTYWVYKDSASGVLDSVIVKETSSEMFAWVDNPKKSNKVSLFEERFTVTTKSFYDTYEYNYEAHARSSDCNNDYCAFVYRVKIIPNVSETGFNDVLLFPFQIGIAGSMSTITNKYDSLLVDGKYYKKVVEFYCSQNYTENNHQTYFYVAKNYGIIKKKILEYQGNPLGVWEWRTWELTTSSIKQ